MPRSKLPAIADPQRCRLALAEEIRRREVELQGLLLAAKDAGIPVRSEGLAPWSLLDTEDPAYGRLMGF